MGNYMRILHISPRYIHSEIGGGERYPFELAKALSKYVETVLLVFGEKRETIKMNKLSIEIYPELRFGRLLKMDPFSISFIREVKDADIIHIHQFRKIISNFSIILGKLRNKPVFVTDHGGGDPISIYITSFIVGHFVSSFLTVSKFSGKQFIRYGKPIRPIYGGVDVSKFYPRKVKKKRNKILFVGRIIPHKGCEYLLQAVQDIDVELHIVGFPSNMKEVRFLKSIDKNRRARFSFNISDEDLAKEYSSSIVTVLPSVYTDYYGKFHPIPELLGLTLLESMACGTPVICTKVGGMPEIVADGETGFLVNPNDPMAIRDRIEYLISNPDEARKMGESGRRMVLESYTWDAVANRCLAAYREFL